MSAIKKSKKAASARYSKEQKQEIVDYVLKYNAEKKRGGVSAAVKAFKVSPITINSWLKAAGSKSATKAKPAAKVKTKAAAKKKSKTAAKAKSKPAAKKTTKAAAKAKSKPAAKVKSKSAAKSAKKSVESKPFGSGARGVRYSAEQKAEVVDFVSQYNATKGRGGQSAAAKKFGLSILTVSSWLKSPKIAGSKSVGSKKVQVPADLNAKFASLIEVSDQLRKTEAEAVSLRAKYDALRAAIQALI